MWVFMRDSFLSIVEHESESRLLQVRARIRGDIERIFPEADVVETLDVDYRFCTSLPRERVSQAIALRLSKINYSEFPMVVEDEDRLQAYLEVWGSMYEEQHRRYGPVPQDVDEVEPPAPRYVLDDPRFNLDSPDEEPVTILSEEKETEPIVAGD